MLTVTIKIPPNDTSTVTVSHVTAGTFAVFAFPHERPSESATRANCFAEDMARVAPVPVNVLCELADAVFRHRGVERAGCSLLLAASLFRGY